jgi:hypothetical protein
MLNGDKWKQGNDSKVESSNYLQHGYQPSGEVKMLNEGYIPSGSCEGGDDTSLASEGSTPPSADSAQQEK